MWPKNMWKRILHLMQQHKTPRKVYTTDQYTTNTLQDKFSHTKITKEKENQANAMTDRPRMT